MKRATKILVPIDFSTGSESALGFAMQLANKTEADLHILHVPTIDRLDMANAITTAFEIDELFVQSKSRMRRIIQKVTKSVNDSLDENLVIESSVEIGRAGATICEVAKKNHIDYVVLGTQGERRAQNKYLGSVASKVLRDLPCSVIAIPENPAFLKNVVVGYTADISNTDLSEVRRKMKFLIPFQPTIKCVHLDEKQSKSETENTEFSASIAEADSDLAITVSTAAIKRKVKDMRDFIKSENINMLVLHKTRHSLFSKSFAQKFARHTDVPVLVLMS